MTFALVFAMTGGAYAARKYIITSTKQIKPSVLKQLKGNRGPAGPAGERGLAGVNGTNGKDGVNGKDGANGKSVVVTKAAAGCPASGVTVEVEASGVHNEVCNGETGFTEALPAGKTEKGSWVVTVPAPNPTFHVSIAEAAISFVIPLSSEPTGIYLAPSEIGKEHTQECPGTVEEPKAAKGFLCVYAQQERNTPSMGVTPLGSVGAIIGGPGGEPGGLAVGSWAVTAE
jgi:hypothetical protein